MHTFKLTPKEITTLRISHKKAKRDKNANHAYRLNALILLGQGWTYVAVSDALLIDEDTIRCCVGKYESGGIDALLSDNYIPYLGRLTAPELKDLELHLSETTYRTVEEIVLYVKETYDEVYSISGLTALLHKLNFVYKKPKRTPGKSDVEKQKEFIKLYNKIKSELEANDNIYFLDATHPNNSSIASYGWIKKGEIKALNATVSRQRLNIHGALNVNDFSVVTRYDKTINQASAIELLFDLRKKQPKGKIYTILDNASYYQNPLFQKYAKELAITPLYLPAYSPNLNLIERLWLFFQKKQIYNKYYATFLEFEKSIKSFFKNIHKHKNELATLLVDNFNIVSLETP